MYVCVGVLHLCASLCACFCRLTNVAEIKIAAIESRSQPFDIFLLHLEVCGRERAGERGEREGGGGGGGRHYR